MRERERKPGPSVVNRQHREGAAVGGQLAHPIL
jgi:hypothetical protein